MAYYGVNVTQMVQELSLKFKVAIQQKGGNGLRGLRLCMKRLDYN